MPGGFHALRMLCRQVPWSVVNRGIKGADLASLRFMVVVVNWLDVAFYFNDLVSLREAGYILKAFAIRTW